MPNIPNNLNDRTIAQHKGTMLSTFGIDTKQEVDDKANHLSEDGYKILSGLRITGAGYYEFETLDPANNRL